MSAETTSQIDRMATNSSHLSQLQQIKERNFSENEASILTLWENSMDLATRGSATEAARKIDQSCPPFEESESSGQTAEFVWMLWDIMFDIASSPDVTTEVQQQLVSIVLELRKIDRGTVSLDLGKQQIWKDLPDFSIALDASRSDPTYTDMEPITDQSAQRWLKFNEFGARLLEADAAGLYLSAIWVLRSALEEELPTTEAEPAGESAADCRVRAASFWILRCANKIFEWAQENADPETSPPESSCFHAGALYSGRPVMCPERWQFWLHRLEQLEKPEFGLRPQTREIVVQAAQIMRTAQGDATNA